MILILLVGLHFMFQKRSIGSTKVSLVLYGLEMLTPKIETCLRVHWYVQAHLLCVWGVSALKLSILDTPSQRNKMQKSIWNVTSEVLKYNAVRPEHPVKIVDNAIKFLNQKYKVSKFNLILQIIPVRVTDICSVHLGRTQTCCGCWLWEWNEHC